MQTIPLTSGHLEWGFVCGRVSVLEARILSTNFFESLLSQKSVVDMMRQLQETPLREAATTGGETGDWSGNIDRHLRETVLAVRHDSPDPAVANLFLLRGDYQNLKVAVTGQNTFPFLPALLPREAFTGVAAGDPSVLPSPYREAAATAMAVSDEKRNHILTDMILDGAFFRHLLAITDHIGVPLVTKYVESMIIIRAILALWRTVLTKQSVKDFQRYMLPLGNATTMLNALAAAGDPKNWPSAVGGEIGELMRQALESGGGEEPQRFEDLTADFLLAIARQGQGQVYGPERVLSFLRTLATEAHNLKLVVCGRINGIDTSVLRRRLRACNA